MTSCRKTSCFVNSRSNEAWFPTHTSTIPLARSHFPTHHMLCTLSSPPLTKLRFSFHELLVEQDAAFGLATLELNLC